MSAGLKQHVPLVRMVRFDPICMNHSHVIGSVDFPRENHASTSSVLELDCDLYVGEHQIAGVLTIVSFNVCDCCDKFLMGLGLTIVSRSQQQ